MSKKLAELLLKDRLITAEQFKRAEQESATRGGYIRSLIAAGFVSETKLLYYLSQKFGLPSINLDRFEIKSDILNLVPIELARRVGVIPLQSNKGTLVVAVCDPSTLPELQSIKFKLKMNVEAVLTTYSAFDKAFQKNYGGGARVGEAISKFKEDQTRLVKKEEVVEIQLSEVHDIDENEDDGPVITLVNGILSEGIRLSASDIHVEPYERIFRVRMRVDGALIQTAEIPLEMRRAVIARFKIMSRMDISESRIPQDGRIKLKAMGREIDFRVNSLPTLFGEKIVLRMLNQGNLELNLEKLGFEQSQLNIFHRGISAPNGMVLVTGPTGSGKTTTLYSALSELNDLDTNLSTVEDPVEYNLSGINQVQIRKEVGLSFASALRALLRQDPDVVLVGEIRDFETAEVAVQAALTGHLVLSTLHTNDAPSTIIRLMNMGLEPFLVTASVNTIVAQRLVRLLCSKCKTPENLSTEQLLKLGFLEEQIPQINVFKAKGCASCSKTGYKGRLAIYEVMPFDDKLKEMVLTGATAIELRRQAVKDGMQSLRASALAKVASGLTTMEEALSITKG